MDCKSIYKINKEYWNTNADSWFGATALPQYGVQFITEEDLHLFGNVHGKVMLDIGCGSGHSLSYHADRGAAELWGLDLSQKQLDNAKAYLSEKGHRAKLICSPMEEDCDIPKAYFDYVYSIYAIGWANDLEKVFKKIASYLKPGGIFIFSWKHPLHSCVSVADSTLIFEESYFDESWRQHMVDGMPITLPNRKISTYINALANAGFTIEQMIEQTDSQTLSLKEDLTDRSFKAQKLPLSFVFKAKKA